MEAVGGFLRGVREARGMKPADVVRAMRALRDEGFSSGTLGKIERGEMVPRLDLLAPLLRVLRVSATRVQEIALRPELTVDEAAQLGRKFVEQEAGRLTDDEIELLNDLPPERRRRAIELIRQLLAE